MHRERFSRQASMVAALGSILTLGVLIAPASTQSAAPGGGAPFLQPDRCYRLTFAIPGATNWKVREILENGWVKAEVDAGPTATLHEPVWVNTAQLVTVRDAKCSD